MKKILSLMICITLAALVNAKDYTGSYVISGDKTYFCEKVRVGLFNTTVFTDEGKIKIANSEVSSYLQKGKLFEKLTVPCEGSTTGCPLMMEYVTSNNGLRLYKRCEYGEYGDLATNNYKKCNQVSYYVFKDGEFYLNVTSRNAPTVLPFFGIDVQD